MLSEDKYDKLSNLVENESKQGLEKLIHPLGFHDTNSLHKFHSISKFKYDSFLDVIKSVDNEKGIKLIIMATRGASIDKAYGSNGHNGKIKKLYCACYFE